MVMLGEAQDIQYIEADRGLIARLGERWGSWAAEHCTTENGFTIVAISGDELVGFIGVWVKTLPAPLSPRRRKVSSTS